MQVERINETLLFRAGKGEWYNQPHNRVWDMGEDAEQIPPARWHVELQSTLATQPDTPPRVVLDLTEMVCLVGQDWGFLVRLLDELSKAGSRLALVARDNVAAQSRILKLHERMPVYKLVSEALAPES